MSNIGPPACDFERLRPVTMTIIASYNVDELNLPGLFAFLPVTDQVLPPHLNFQKKQGKIRLPPELNHPGEILSMRYDKQVRGIVRSEKAKSFSHSIIIDVGTSTRIVSVKLSRTLELTGPTSFEIAKEAAGTVLNHVKNCQENLNFLRTNRDLAIKTKHKFLHFVSGGEVEIDKDDETEMRIWEMYRKQTKGYAVDKINDFLDFMLNFNRNLYTGTLEINSMESEMVNILFNLGFSINQVVFANVMNNFPFECKFTNAKNASAVNVFYHYTKIDRTTGQPKEAKHTIRVNKSGHVRHSGPNLQTMKSVYYTFIQRVLQYHTEIQSIENCKQQLRVTGTSKALSITEWKEFLNQEESFRNRILAGKLPMVNINIPQPEPSEEPIITTEILGSQLPAKSEQVNSITQNPELPSLMFDYTPLLSTR
ncbi:hypothetical protein BH23THE1_BH23THE1_33300 [soil metagenome]